LTRFLLNTDALIDFSKGAEPATSSILSWIDGSEAVAVCAVTVLELYAGLTAEEASHWALFIVTLPYCDISRDAARRAGQYRYTFARAGYQLTTTDALLAAVALENEATLVTGNVKDFPMKNLSLLSLRS